MINSKTICCCLLLILTLVSCKKNEEFNSDLPDRVELNEAVIFLNGEMNEEYSSINVYNREVYNIMAYGFANLHPEIAGVTAFSFDRCPRSVGRFALTNDEDAAVTDETVCSAGMSQTVDEDLGGQEFELHEDSDNYLEITELDYENEIAGGHFKVKFKRTSNGGSSFSNVKLPKWVTFEGIFRHEFKE